MLSEDRANLVEEAVQLLPRIVRCLHEAYSGYAEVGGLTLGQIKALAFLYHHDRATISEIADGLGVALPTASELIDKLVERSLVERATNPLNRRQVLVRLTDSALTIGREIHDARRAQVRQAFSLLSPIEQEAFVRGLQALSASLGSTPTQSCADKNANTRQS